MRIFLSPVVSGAEPNYIATVNFRCVALFIARFATELVEVSAFSVILLLIYTFNTNSKTQNF